MAKSFTFVLILISGAKLQVASEHLTVYAMENESGAIWTFTSTNDIYTIEFLG